MRAAVNFDHFIVNAAVSRGNTLVASFQ